MSRARALPLLQAAAFPMETRPPSEAGFLLLT